MMIFKMLNSDSDFKANGEASQSNSSGKSLSEAFIFASNNPQYDNRLFMELPYKCKTWAEHIPHFSFHGNSMKNLLSYCGLVDETISASEEDLPVQLI